MRFAGPLILLLLSGFLSRIDAADATKDAARFNYILGTQAIGGRYQFTEDTRLVESAKQIQSLGSNVMKFALSREGAFGAETGNIPTKPAAVRTLTDLVSREPSHRAVLEMPFTHYLLWVYPLTSATQAGVFQPEDHERQYREMHDFACHLLRTYSGSGKHFYLGHWEGDWHLRPHYGPTQPFAGGAGARFTEWLRIRQKAVDDAKRDTPHRDVWVWHYTEVNLVTAFLKGGQCLTNDILPEVDIDYVSYSAYDAIDGDIRGGLFAALDHIESRLRPKRGIPGRRVFIGEYGFAARRHGAEAQNERAIGTMLAGIEWGCPFVLYWELYCNERRDGKPEGFWLINDRNEKQPAWFTHERYFAWARGHVTEVIMRTGSAPTDAEFRTAAADYFRNKAAKR